MNYPRLLRVFVGDDSREATARRVCEASLQRHARMRPWIGHLDFPYLQATGRYTRPTERRNGRWHDVISDSPMATMHSLARFLVTREYPAGWALFTDCDVLWRAPVDDLFALCDDRFAVLVVQHGPKSRVVTDKMDGQIQTHYARKWWSSVCLWNPKHPANAKLTLAEFNTRPGLWLHQFGWLDDSEIGCLPPEWNHLVGLDAHDPAAKLAHFTLGTPDMKGYERQPFADEWRGYLEPADGKAAHV